MSWSRDEFESLGVVGQLEEMARRYIDSVDGVLTLRKNALDTQIGSVNDRIEDMDVRLEQRREALSRQFIAMERAIASLQTQQSALQSISLIG